MGKIRCKGINNQGSTLIVVIIIVSFISILSTVCISAAMINFKMKTMDRESKKTFYTAEQAVDQIYTGLGKLSMEKLDQAYSEELSTIIRQSVIGGNVVLSSVGNITANAELRKSFTKKVVENIINTPNSWNNDDAKDFEHDTYSDKLIDILNSYLEDRSKAKVKSVGNISIVKETSTNDNILSNYVIKFDDCAVEYVKDTNGYRANVTFDGVISLPDVVVQFTQDVNNRIDSLKNYSLIGNSGIELSLAKKLSITGGAYAGGDGFNMAAGSEFTAKDATIISKGDIRLYGSTCTITGNSNIWCENILLPSKDSSNMACNNATLTIENTCKTYVKDDIQVDGGKSNVSVSGDYYGYSYAGNSAPGTTGDADSSAIIVNGIGSAVDLRGIKTLVLGGRAYITFESAGVLAGTYMTGESLSLKGNQEVYLVPTSLITDNSTGKYMSNPMSDVKFKSATTNININETNFFGYSYLNKAKPYTEVTVGTNDYIYLNFDSPTASANYFKSILNDAVFNGVYDALSATVKNDTVYQAYQNTRNYMKSILEVNMAQLTQTCLINTSSGSGSSIYTNGSLINASLNGTSTGTASDVTTSTYSIDGSSVDAFSLNDTDLTTRYSIVSRLLYNPSMYKMNNGTYVTDASGNYVRDIMTSTTNSIIYEGQAVNLSNYNTNVFENFINTNYLASQTSPFIRTSSGTAGTNVMYAFGGSGGVVIDDTFPYSGGVIIASGPVVIQKDCTFNGLIIAGGKIYVKSNAVVGNSIIGYSNIIDFINQCDTTGDFKKYFKCWNSADVAPADGAGEIKSISDITYKKLVSFDNWIKN